MHPSFIEKTKFFLKLDRQHTCLHFSLYKEMEKMKVDEEEDDVPHLFTREPQLDT